MKNWLMKKLRAMRTQKTAIAAGILSGGEAAVTMGVPLPFAEVVPLKARGAAIALLVAAAFYFRWKASQGEKGDA